MTLIGKSSLISLVFSLTNPSNFAQTGFGGPIVPGTRLAVRVEFPIHVRDENVDPALGVVPCHRVCVGLVGSEHAVFEGSSAAERKRTKTKSYVFDSSYQLVDYGYTEAVALDLLLPLNSPVSVKTDLVEVEASLKVEFTVGRNVIRPGGDGDDNAGERVKGYDTINLEVPVRIVHVDPPAQTGEDEDGQTEVESAVSEMRRLWKNEANTSDFDEAGIQRDLRMLSLHCYRDLKETP